jgi:hypothetical protein
MENQCGNGVTNKHDETPKHVRMYAQRVNAEHGRLVDMSTIICTTNETRYQCCSTAMQFPDERFKTMSDFDHLVILSVWHVKSIEAAKALR